MEDKLLKREKINTNSSEIYDTQQQLDNSNNNQGEQNVVKANRRKFSVYIVISLTLAMVFLLAAIIIPSVLLRYLEKTYQSSNYLNNNNLDLWSKIPGKLDFKTTHKFNVYNITDSSTDIFQAQAKYKSDLFYEFDQSGSFKNFKFSDKKKTVTATSNFNINYHEPIKTSKDDKTQVENEVDPLEKEFIHLNPEKLEAWHNLVNIPIYISGPSGFRFAVGDDYSKDFSIKLFAAYFYNTIISKSEMTKAWLSGLLDQKTITDLFSTKSQYSWSTPGGFFNWALFIKDFSLIDTSTWLQTDFNITPELAKKIVGPDSFVNSQYNFLQLKYSLLFNCFDVSSYPYQPCTNEQLIYAQITTSQPVLYLNYNNIESVSDLNELLFKEKAVNLFEQDPEVFTFFKKSFSGRNVVKYDDIKPINSTQAEMLFSEKYKYSPFKPEYGLELLIDYLSGNIYNAYNKYLINSQAQFDFYVEYIFIHCTKNYYFLKFKDEKGHWQASNGEHKALTRVIIDSVNRSYNTLKNSIRLVSITKALFAYASQNKLSCEQILNKFVEYEIKKEVCETNKLLNFDDYHKTKEWVLPYECNYKDCIDKEITVFSKRTSIPESSVRKLFTDKSSILVIYLDKIESEMKNKYSCASTKCESIELAKKQIFNSFITLNPIDIIISEKQDSISKWDDEIFFFSPEMKNLSTEDSNVFDIGTAENYLKVYSDVFYYLNETTDFKLSFFKSIDQLKKVTLNAKKILLIDLKPEKTSLKEMLLGKDIFDFSYINYGSYLDGFKPGLKRTRGIFFSTEDIKGEFDLIEKYPYYENFMEMMTGNTDLSPNSVRNITKINGFNFFNVKNVVHYSNETTKIKNTPLYYTLNTNKTNSTAAEIENTNISEKKSKTRLNGYITDGVMFSNDYFTKKSKNEKLLYYDSISSRVLPFKYYGKSSSENGLNCVKYILEEDYNIGDEYGNDMSIGYYEPSNINFDYIKNKDVTNVFSKFSKPYTLTSKKIAREKTDSGNSNNENEENYLCVDPNTYIVVESKINLVYMVDLIPLRALLDLTGLKASKYIPLFHYSKKSSLDSDKYSEVYSKIKPISKLKIAAEVIFYVLVGFFVIVALYSGYQIYKKHER